MTSDQQDSFQRDLQQSTALQPRRRSSRVLISLILTGLGGFVGGMLTSYGPTYLNIYLAQPVLAQDAGPRVTEVQPAEFTPPPAVQPASTAASEAPVPKGGEARLVVQSHDGSYLVLRSDAPSEWGQGRIHSGADTEGFIYTLQQETQSSALPAELLAYQDREFVLHDGQGYVCTAKTGSLKLIQQAARDYDEGPHATVSWDEYGGGPLLVAQLSSSRGSCKGALWGRDASLPPASIARISSVTRALKREARTAFRDTQIYKTLQSDFEQQGGSGRWDLSDTQSLSFAALKSAEQELVLVSSQFGGCGEFEAQVGVLFRRNDAGTLERIEDHEGLMLGIDAAADIDGDGDLDLFTSGDGFDRSLMLQNDGLIQDTHSTVNIYYCRC